MQTLPVNGYDIAYLDVGKGPPLVCVHGTLGDFRTWYPVLGPLSKKHRVISLSLRHFFPEHWDGVGNDYLMAQHVADVIGFIEQAETRPRRPDGPFPRRAYRLSRRRSSGRIYCASWCWPSPAATSTPRSSPAGASPGSLAGCGADSGRGGESRKRRYRRRAAT